MAQEEVAQAAASAALGPACGHALPVRIRLTALHSKYAAVNLRSLLFVCVQTTEWDFTTGSAQYNFIKSALASVDRSVTPWVIFMGHRPM